MNPHFFSESSRALFGIHTPARGLAEIGVVICPPLGQEGLTAHRSLRILADRLADAGVEVLRFDYYGTGDSSGEMRDGDLSLWAGNVRTATQHLREVAPVRRVVLVGLRLGATLALLAEVPATSRIILWDPVLDGRHFIADLLVPPLFSTPVSGKWAASHSVNGFVADLESLDLGAIRRVPRRSELSPHRNRWTCPRWKRPRKDVGRGSRRFASRRRASGRKTRHSAWVRFPLK